MNVSLLEEAVGWQFLRTNIDGEDEGFEAACHQRGFTMIRPDNDWFPGLDELREDFYSHQWIFGKTPKFKVAKSFNVPQEISNLPQECQLSFELEVVNGTIQDVRVQMPPEFLDSELVDLSDILLKLPFNEKLLGTFADLLEKEQEVTRVKKDFLVQSLDEMISKFV